MALYTPRTPLARKILVHVVAMFGGWVSWGVAKRAREFKSHSRMHDFFLTRT